MGIRDFFSSSTEAVKRNAPGLSLVKNSFTTSYNYGSIACRASYNYGSAACAKIGDMCGLQKLKQWLPGDKAQSRIGVVATNAALYTLHDSCRLGPGWLYRLAPDLLYRFVPGLLLNRSDPVMEDDAVWISICYPVEYEQSAEGVWNWKYIGNGKGKTTPILVSETISYANLYDIIREVLNIDTRLFKIKMSALVPIMRKAPAAPIIIDCDDNVKWFVSVCRETFLCVTISSEEVENHKEFGEDVVKNNSEDEHVRTDDDGNYANLRSTCIG